MAIKRRNKIDAGFSMASMTDIIFLLLVFFMITSTMINPNGLEVSLPKSSNQVKDKPSIAVSINKDLQFAIDKELIDFEMIEASLKSKLSNIEEPSISLHVDKTVPVEEVVKIMNIAKNNRWRLVLATTP